MTQSAKQKIDPDQGLGIARITKCARAEEAVQRSLGAPASRRHELRMTAAFIL
jgi:hypothetical protein